MNGRPKKVFLLFVGVVTFVYGVSRAGSLTSGCRFGFDPRPAIMPLSVAIWVGTTLWLRWRRHRPIALLRATAGAVFMASFLAFLFSPSIPCAELWRAKGTMFDMVAKAAFLERYAKAHGEPPAVASIDALSEALAPYSGNRPCSTADGWGNPYVVEMVDGQLQITSCGRCGEPDGLVVDEPPREGDSLAGDIVLRGDRFLRYPYRMPPSRFRD